MTLSLIKIQKIPKKNLSINQKKAHENTKTTKLKNDTNFTICNWNCARGLTKKLNDIKLLINELKPSLIFVSEADIKITHHTDLIRIPGYKLHLGSSLQAKQITRIIAYEK